MTLLAALAAGLVVGAERGWEQREEADGARVAGIRTFMLTALLGGICGLASSGEWLLLPAVGLAAVAALSLVSYRQAARVDADVGATTEIALLATYVLGVLAASGQPLAAMAAAAAMSLILGLKRELHRTLRHIERSDILTSLQLIVIAVVVLPLLPDTGIGPWDSVNPRTVGLLVLLLLGLSFVGFAAVRAFGERRGILLTAFMGGLTSSTAVTLAYARFSRQPGANVRLLGVGIALSAATMAPRLMVEVAAIRPSLVAEIWLPLAVLGAIPLAAAIALGYSSSAGGASVEPAIRNPLNIGAAAILAAGLVVMFAAIRGVQEWFGATGTYGLAAVSGILDVDALAVSVAGNAESMGEATAGRAIVIAALVNTASKALLAWFAGGIRLGLTAGVVLGVALVAAAGVEFL